MKRKIKRVKTAKLSVSLPVDMVEWLINKANTEENGNISGAIRRLLQPHFQLKRGNISGPLSAPALVPDGQTVTL